MNKEEKCPNCGAAVNTRKTWDSRALRPKGDMTDDMWVWECGRASWVNKDTMNCLIRQLVLAKKENIRLRAGNAELGRLTADGVVANEGMSVWFPWNAEYDPGLADGVVCFRVSAEEGLHYIHEAYSTPEAAEEAKARKEE